MCRGREGVERTVPQRDAGARRAAPAGGHATRCSWPASVSFVPAYLISVYPKWLVHMGRICGSTGSGKQEGEQALGVQRAPQARAGAAGRQAGRSALLAPCALCGATAQRHTWHSCAHLLHAGDDEPFHAHAPQDALQRLQGGRGEGQAGRPHQLRQLLRRGRPACCTKPPNSWLGGEQSPAYPHPPQSAGGSGPTAGSPLWWPQTAPLQACKQPKEMQLFIEAGQKPGGWQGGQAGTPWWYAMIGQ